MEKQGFSFDKAVGAFEKAVNCLELALNLLILGVIGVQIITRTFLNMPLKFPEEVAVFALIASIYAGVCIVEKDDEYLRIEVFQNLLPLKVRQVMQLIAKLLLMLVIFGILQGELAIFPSIAMLKSTAAKIPYSWLHGWIIAFVVIWAAFVVLDTVKLIRKMRGGPADPAEPAEKAGKEDASC